MSPVLNRGPSQPQLFSEKNVAAAEESAAHAASSLPRSSLPHACLDSVSVRRSSEELAVQLLLLTGVPLAAGL